MKRFTEAGRKAVENENLYAALTVALMIPDICASLEEPGMNNSKKRYIGWCKKWLEPEYTSPAEARGRVFLSAENLYQARCSVIHSGTAEIEPGRRTGLDEFAFFADGSHLTLVRGGVVKGIRQPNVLQLRVDMFCETVFAAAEKWDTSVADDANIQAEKTKLLVIHPPGIIIAGVCFS